MNAILLLSLGACAKPPTVPEERWVDISPQAVESIEALRAHEAALTRGVPEAELDVVEARRRGDLAESRLALLQDALRGEDQVKKAAVESGDAAAAQASDLRRAQHEVAIAEARSAVIDTGARQVLAEAELELLRADIDLVHAHLELERARAIDPTGEDLRIPRFERAVRQATERRTDAVLRTEQARGALPPAA